jgi:hypothetical protein
MDLSCFMLNVNETIGEVYKLAMPEIKYVVRIFKKKNIFVFCFLKFSMTTHIKSPTAPRDMVCVIYSFNICYPVVTYFHKVT